MSPRNGPLRLSSIVEVFLLGGSLLLWFAAGNSALQAQRAAGPALARASVRPVVPPATPRTADQIKARIEAAVRGLDHVPGEVLVKFRVAVTPMGHARVLVPWKRDELHKSRSAAPASQGATTEDSGPL